jgi:hypothetical protein
MPVMTDWEVEFNADDVLRGQGADPAVLRSRSSRLVAAAENAVVEANHLIQPLVIYKELDVETFRHQKIILSDGSTLEGDLIGQRLAGSRRVALVACTISDLLRQRVSEIMDKNIVGGLALDGAGNAAVEALARSVCRWLEERAAALGWDATNPLNPGMEGWPVEEGQAQIFHSLHSESNGIQLNEGSLMLPLKSLSFVVGMGSGVLNSDNPCQFCVLKGNCRYQNQHAAN